MEPDEDHGGRALQDWTRRLPASAPDHRQGQGSKGSVSQSVAPAGWGSVGGAQTGLVLDDTSLSADILSSHVQRAFYAPRPEPTPL